jgi:hypothetical protein
MLASSSAWAKTSASPTTARRRVTNSTISSAIYGKFNNLGDVFFVLEFCNAVVFPDVLNQCFYIATDSIDMSVSRTEDARILTICTIAVTFDYEAIGDLEDSLVTILVLTNLPRLAGGEMQCVFAMWTIWYSA